MTKLTLMLLGSLAAFCGEALAEPSARRSLPGDENTDGQISRQEAVSGAVERFERMDKNADGQVTQDEMKADHDARRQEREARRAKMRKGRDGRRFDRLDLDGDNMLSREEIVSGAERRFDNADADKDGFVTKDEMRAAGKARRGRASEQ